MKCIPWRVRRSSAVLLLLAVACASGGGEMRNHRDLPAYFDGKFGQLEVGGPFAGAEFHFSRPLPARISFYYPVANSIDLSTDYWRRGESRPLRFTLRRDGQVDSIGAEPWAYHYTPYFAEFAESKSGYRCSISYRFCQNLPVMVLQLNLTNTSDKAQVFGLESDLQCLLRTCQTYAEKRPNSIDYKLQNPADPQSGCILAAAAFDAPDADSALVFVGNAGALPTAKASREFISLRYAKKLQPGEEWQIIQLIGSCRQGEADAITDRAAREWQKDAAAFENASSTYAKDELGLDLPDAALMQTARWSRAVMAANRHYIDGKIVPMPCPAEYNFFFTHDLLLTDLGAVYFDCDRVKTDLLYVKSLCKADSILPHAYYWRDTGFQTEFCASDNWNHLWFIILTASYLRHSGDIGTVRLLMPMLQKSLKMMLENRGADDLMYAWQPDWWDIGHVYSARAYITMLMIRAMREYAYIGLRLGADEQPLSAGLILAQRMQQQLGEKLWDEKSRFLINGLDSSTMDYHYYAGSLLAPAWKMIDSAKSAALLKTAADQLLDRQLGIRIVTPMDFHQLTDLYQFKAGEVGAAGLYINGGVWPHGIAWYALGLLATEQPDSARMVLKKYLTLDGISHSPHGQPAFFEYRNSDPASPNYGEIDKPTFLWTGGWFLHALYQLAGLRENEWNLSFSPLLPSGWKDVNYTASIQGKSTAVAIKGEGAYFSELRGDAGLIYSAVITRPFRTLVFKRGLPKRPYLAAANCLVDSVQFLGPAKVLQIDVRGLPGQAVELQIVSPFAPLGLNAGLEKAKIVRKGNVRVISVQARLEKKSERFAIRFGDTSTKDEL